MAESKIPCWTIAYSLNDVKMLISVKANSRSKAADKLVTAGFGIKDATHIRKTCIILPPFPDAITQLQEYDWEENAKPIIH